MIANKLSVNTDKTKFILFKTVQSKIPAHNHLLYLRKCPLKQVDTLKFLGVHINEHLTWSRHINHLISKVRSVIANVIKVKSLLNKKSFLIIYHSLINSQLLYCITNWCFGNKTLIKRLQQLCNRFLKNVFNVCNQNVQVFMRENKLLTIEQLLTKELNLFMFKQFHNSNPTAFNDLFITNKSKYNTRNKSNIVPTRCSTTICQQKISYRAPTYWINLPYDLKNKKTARSFSLNLRNYFLSDKFKSLGL